MRQPLQQPSWVQLQQKTMIRWLNTKIEDPNYDKAAPAITCKPVTNLVTDLQDGLVLIKLVNQLIHERSQAKPSADNLYYLTPLYPKPTFKLQKVENLNDFLKFIKLILNINVSTISADNIFDGDLKLILGLIWSLFLLSTTNSFRSYSSSPSYVEIKTILANWIDTILVKHNLSISNFNKDWSVEINRPELILSLILQHYNINNFSTTSSSQTRLNTLASILAFAELEFAIPHLIDVDDFTLLVPDEKCIVTYLVEWFKVFEIEKSYMAKAAENERYDDLVELITLTDKLKNKYETKALRFLNKTNSLVALLNQGLEHLQEYADEPSRVVRVFETVVKHSPEIQRLIGEDFPELQRLLNFIEGNLDELNLVYYPVIKLLNMHHIAEKQNSLFETYGQLAAKSQQIATSSRDAQVASYAGKFGPIEQAAVVSEEHDSFHLTAGFFHNFKTAFTSYDNLLTRFELKKFLRLQIVTHELDPTIMDSFIKLIPTKSTKTLVTSGSSLSINDGDEFKLLSASSSTLSFSDQSDDEDFMFDEIQLRLESQLSGMRDKVYDIHEFIDKLGNGFSI